MNETEAENLRALYSENGRITQTYLEWRLKVISRYFISVIAMFALAKWLYDSDQMKQFLWIPLALGAIASLIFLFMNETISKVLSFVAIVGSDIEKKLSKTEGCYTHINRWLSSTWINSKIIWEGYILY